MTTLKKIAYSSYIYACAFLINLCKFLGGKCTVADYNSVPYHFHAELFTLVFWKRGIIPIPLNLT